MFLLIFAALYTVPFSSLAFSHDKDQLTMVRMLQYQAYLENDTKGWKRSIAVLTEMQQENDAPEVQFYLAKSYLGLLNTAMAKRDESLFDTFEDQAFEAVKVLKKHEQYRSEALAWLGALYGWTIAFSPIKGMYYGPKASSVLEDAREANPQCAEAWVRSASSLYFTPEAFGGDPQEALNYYQKGVSLYEKDSADQEWAYLDALAWLGQAYLKNGQPEEAIATYRKALHLEPGFYWVKEVLLPEALQ